MKGIICSPPLLPRRIPESRSHRSLPRVQEQPILLSFSAIIEDYGPLFHTFDRIFLRATRLGIRMERRPSMPVSYLISY